MPDSDRDDPERDSSADVEYATVGDKKIWYFSFFIGGIGTALLRRFPTEDPVSVLTEAFRESGWAEQLGIEPDYLAELVARNAPWQ